METIAKQYTRSIFNQSTLVIEISGIGGKLWKRNVTKGSRIGPWLQANYEIVNTGAWKSKEACLYFVSGTDQKVRYVGISRNGLNHRWRTSPAYEAETMERLDQNQLFHSQCWKHIESETALNPKAKFQVRSIDAATLIPLLQKLGDPISAFCALRDDAESVVAGVERWICNNSDHDLARWNV
jgi:hypothetical protein